MACERDSRPLDLSNNRDRERDRSKSDISNHTNSSDPNLLMSRVFVANLPTERVSRDDLEEMFGKCGKILTISIVSGYGFVQYEEKGIARQACKMENGSLLKGNKLDVKMAFEGQRKGKKNVLVTQPRRELPPPRRESPSRQPFERQRSRSPLRERDAYKQDPFVPPEVVRPPLRHGIAERPAFDCAIIVTTPKLRQDPFVPPEVVRPPLRHGMAEKPAFDCAIIVTNPKLRSYAEMIEQQLKSSALLSEHKIAAEELLRKAVADAKRRGVLFVVILNEQNELYHSLTLIILHGTPQEHRNMPLDDAIVLIEYSFEAYMLELREKATAPVVAPTPVAPNKDFIPPDQHTLHVLNLLVDSRFVTAGELDQAISYLQSRKHQLADGMPKA